MTELSEHKFETLLEFLRDSRGFDFTGYKRQSLMRRVARRMEGAGVEDFEAYIDYLEVHPDEFAQLFNTILINVTSFFRDAAAWEFLRGEVLPQLVAAKGANAMLRVWSAGCAAGQETYSLAMSLAEALGMEAFRERVKVYGTDADEGALSQARLGAYAPKELEHVEPALVTRYFEPSGGRLVFRADLRRSVIFGRHDLVQDAPISRLDLLACRNTLMYFNSETQAAIMRRFHFALNGEGTATGYLFLGRAEMLLSHSALFTPLNLKHRVFVRVAPPPGSGARQRVLPLAGANGEDIDLMRNDKLREQALDDSPLARIVVDTNGMLALANQKARLLFSLGPNDIGRPLQDLEVSYRPAELRSLIEQAYVERRTVTQPSVERRFADGERHYFDIVVAPLFDDARRPLGVGVSFVDVTRHARLSEDLQRSREEIRTANEELQSSNEELETTNEELQSSNEELETTNEELQSTNEELETMNEELQSTNEELQTVNEELRQRTDEMNQLNAFLESVLTGLRAAAVVLSREMNVLIWNRRSEDLWGLRADEVVGRSFLSLDIGLPIAQMRDVVLPCLSGESEHQQLTLQAVNRRGRTIQCRVTCSPLLNARQQRDGAILLMEEVT